MLRLVDQVGVWKQKRYPYLEWADVSLTAIIDEGGTNLLSEPAIGERLSTLDGSYAIRLPYNIVTFVPEHIYDFHVVASQGAIRVHYVLPLIIKHRND